jgi:hypothetical protein
MRMHNKKRDYRFEHWLNNWTEFKPNKVEYGEANQILAGNISVNTKLLKRNIYLIQGNVYVTILC